MTKLGSTIPGRNASSKSRKKIPVVSEGSLKDLIGLEPGFPFWAVVFAHLRISVSVIGRPLPDNELKVLVMFILGRNRASEAMFQGGMTGAPATYRMSCHTSPSTRVFDPSTMSAPWMPTMCMPFCFARSTA